MKNIRIYKYLSVSILGILLPLLISCDKYLSLDPPVDKVTTEVVFTNDDAAKSAIVGIYSRMAASGFTCGDATSVTSFAGLSADEFINYSTSNEAFYRNDLLPTSNVGSIWNVSYQFIYSANRILEGLEQSENITDAVKKQLQGDAKFIRAFCFFYLTNLFGDIPISLSTDYRINNVNIQSKQADVYKRVIIDLLDAENLLTEGYYTTERVRPNKWSVRAMLARVYLYTKNWTEAERLSTSLIDKKPMYALKADLNDVFLSNSSEAIWQLMPNSGVRNTNEALNFIFTATPTSVSVASNLMDAFEVGDKRRSSWIGSVTVNGKIYYYPFKYKVGRVTALTEYSMVLRLAEQYLIRAEARINQNQIDLGIDDLNVLRTRSRSVPTQLNPNPLPPIPYGLDKESALLAVEKERRIEFFSEWGHRWLDLKRTERATTVLAPIKGSSWKPTDALFPIPQEEINANPKIIQNLGY
jgi:hypothetical protein